MLQVKLPYLHWCWPPFLCSPAPLSLSGPSHGALIMGGSGNPNPHYLPHYSLQHKGDLFSGLDSFSGVIPIHIHMETHKTQMHLMPSSVSLFLPCDSFSLVRGLGDQMSTLLCRLFCTEEQRQTISLDISCLFHFAPFTAQLLFTVILYYFFIKQSWWGLFYDANSISWLYWFFSLHFKARKLDSVSLLTTGEQQLSNKK